MFTFAIGVSRAAMLMSACHESLPPFCILILSIPAHCSRLALMMTQYVNVQIVQITDLPVIMRK